MNDTAGIVNVGDVGDPPGNHVTTPEADVSAATAGNQKLATTITTQLDQHPSPPTVIDLFFRPMAWVTYYDDSGPIAQNAVLAEWVLGLLFVTLVWWWINHRSLPAGLLAFSFVFVQYVVVGCVFGVLYYDYYSKDLAKQNFVALSEPAIISRLERNRANNDFVVNVVGHAAGMTESPSESYKSTLAIARAYYWSSSVFAEDLPLYGVSPIHSLRFDIEHTFDLKFPKDHVPIVECPQDRQCSASSPENQLSLARLRAYLGGFQHSYPAGRLEYRVELIAGADRRPVSNDNPDLRSNKDFAQLRANTLLAVLRHEVGLSLSKTQNGALRYLSRASMSPPPATLVSQAEDQSSSGCPAETNCRDDKDWRVARLRILKGTPDENAASNVSLALSRRSSLASMLYFSFATFTTTGYGDIKPVSDVVRFWAMIENIWEILFAALFFTTAVAASIQPRGSTDASEC
jgi:hypothetical protein